MVCSVTVMIRGSMKAPYTMIAPARALTVATAEIRNFRQGHCDFLRIHTVQPREVHPKNAMRSTMARSQKKIWGERRNIGAILIANRKLKMENGKKKNEKCMRD